MIVPVEDKIPIPYVMRDKLPSQQIGRYRALLAFQLRASGMWHNDIARVLNLSGKESARRYVAIGRRLMIDIVIPTIPL
jgi:hypothetical protein